MTAAGSSEFFTAIGVHPSPNDDEAAAIVAAIELAWPRAVMVTTTPAPSASAAAWKWSSRWWVGRKHVAADRRRP